MNVIDQIRLNYPLPIAQFYLAMNLESEPRLRVRKLVELFELGMRYLTLVALASYIYHELSEPKVEEQRRDLSVPTLGDWIDMLMVTNGALRGHRLVAPLGRSGHHYRDGFILKGCHSLSELLGDSPPRSVTLPEFFQHVLRFRNKKIGHGILSVAEAKKIYAPLEGAIEQWLSEMEILREQRLVYLERVEWQDPYFMCFGLNLNQGSSLLPLAITREKAVTPGQVYFHLPTDNTLIPLYPFFVFEREVRLLYMYEELGSKSTLILRCPYEAPEAKVSLPLSFDRAIVVGEEVKPANGSLSRGERNGAAVSKFQKVQAIIRSKMSENWLTDSQQAVWSQLQKFLEPPYYVINIYGATGTGKTFLGWLLEKGSSAVYATHTPAAQLPWSEWKGKALLVLDNYDSSRRAVRALRAELKLHNVGQVVILTRQKAQDDIPCLHLPITEQDIQIVRATLYRELNMVAPEGDLSNLWDCFQDLEK